ADNNEKDRGSCSANVEPRTLHEYYYRAFKGAITEGGAHSIMAAYNELSGVPAVMNPDIQSLLKDKWGLDFVVTDGGDFSQNVLSHEIVKTHAEALALCIKNGADSMTDPADMVSAAAYDALEKGLINEADIDKAVGNVLYGRFRLGEFDDEHPYKNMGKAVDTEEFRAVNREAAMKQMCLLKNDGLLPISKGKKIALTGPIADENYCDWYTGRASYKISVKQGLEAEYGKNNVLFDNGYDIVAIKCCKSGKYLAVTEDGTVKAIANEVSENAKFEMHDWGFGSINFKSVANGLYVTESGAYKAESATPYAWFIHEWFKPTIHSDGLYSFRSWNDWAVDICVDENDVLTTCKPSRMTDNKLFEIVVVSNGAERVKKLAEQADVAIVCAGNHPMQVARECYDRPDIVLPLHQDKLVKAAYEGCKNTILAIVASYPYAINREKEKLPAILYTSHAGAELGTAFAATVSGKNNPAARCPMTWYKSIYELPDIMDYDIITNNSTYLYYDGEPLFPFGHGLSYSKFEYSDFSAVQQGNTVRTAVTVKNVSDVDGDEVVQIYFRHSNPRVKRPLRQLCGFKRVNIKAGETVKVEIDVPWNALEFYDVTREKLCVESGLYSFTAAASSLDVRCTAEIEITGETIPPRDIRCLKAKNYDSKDMVTLDFSFDKNDHYAISHDWGGNLIFNDACFDGYTSVTVLASAPCNTKPIEIYADDKLIGSTDIKPSPCKDGIAEYVIPLETVNGVMQLRVRLGGMLGIYSLNFS
ncbi:MAG: glycoside hydrolase family 3 C-terminal domain-containing protein, partial [Oscillospiraceae bacterium]|nr:glycoside hydrolase family 3 C-terminal domain-containing protein [Oscillospiraceae bacterium]